MVSLMHAQDKSDLQRKISTVMSHKTCTSSRRRVHTDIPAILRQKMDELYNVIAAGQTGEVNETSVSR